MVITVKRLGLYCIAIVHVGNEVYGDSFLDEDLIRLG